MKLDVSNISENSGAEDFALRIDLRGCSAERAAGLLDLVDNASFLDYGYTVLLGRASDPEGRRHYASLLAKGCSRQDIVRRFLRSGEYRAAAIDSADLAPDEFVNRAYQATLGRWPDAEGMETYRRIAGRIGGRRRVISRLRASDEARRKDGGRLARIESLRRFAMTDRLMRIPLIGRWFAARSAFRRRIARIMLNQRFLAQELAELRRNLEDAELERVAPIMFAGADEATDPREVMFQQALDRARREPQGRN